MRFIQFWPLVMLLSSLGLLAADLPSITLDQQQALGIHTTPPVADDVAIRAQVMAVVKQGQVLAEIFVPELQMLEHQYHNALSSAQLTQQKKQREAQLLKEGIIAAKQYEVTQMEYQQAQENALAIFTQMARMGLTESELSLLKDPKNRHLEGLISLNAPVEAKVQQMALVVGDGFDANQPLMTLLTSDALTLEIPLTQTQLGQLQVGQSLSLIDGTRATIINIQNLLSEAQKVMVTASFQHHTLRAGQRVVVLLNQDENQTIPSWRLPRQAIVYLQNQPHVFVINQGQLSAIQVELLRATREGWVILSKELTEQSAVVVSGTAAAKAIYTEGVAP